MTKSEMNFALAVEERLHAISQPELRQLFVEAIVILTSIYQNLPLDVVPGIRGQTVHVERILQRANSIFLEEQNAPRSPEHLANGVSVYFCDLAPSGEFGSMTYITRATFEIIQLPPNVECNMQ